MKKEKKDKFEVERVEVTESELTGEAFWNVFKFRVKNSHMVKKSGQEIKEFLAKQLENYMNQKPKSNWCQGCNQVFSDDLVDGKCSDCIESNNTL